MKTFLDRPIEGDWPYVWIDATYVKVRQAGRIVSVAVTRGRRQHRRPARSAGHGDRRLGGRDLLDRVPAQAHAARPGRRQAGHLRRPRRHQGRGEQGVQRHLAALPRPLHAQRPAHAGKSGRRVVSAFIATAFAQDDAEAAKAQWRQVADQVRPKLPKLAALLDPLPA